MVDKRWAVLLSALLLVGCAPATVVPAPVAPAAVAPAPQVPVVSAADAAACAYLQTINDGVDPASSAYEQLVSLQTRASQLTSYARDADNEDIYQSFNTLSVEFSRIADLFDHHMQSKQDWVSLASAYGDATRPCR